jgi:hypothetical protein
MKSTIFKENKSSSEPAKGSYPLANITGTNQNPHWHARHDSKTDSKSGGQQLTTVNTSGQPDREKGSPGGTKLHHTTAGTGDHERED